ncbi:MAG: hypothetical protein WA101_02285 [Minisyncoccia bacterium]
MEFKIEAESKKINTENETDLVIKEILSGYPERISFSEDFSKELEKIRVKTEDMRNGKFEHKGQREIEYNRHGNNLFTRITKDSKEERLKVSLGEVLSGSEWGKEFYFNNSSFFEKNDGKKIYNKYVNSVAEREILNLLNRYIVENEVKKNEKKDLLKKKAYEQIGKREQEKSLDNMQTGVLAEKMVQSFLIQISTDNPSFNFEIVQANAYQDVDYKIDFIIKTTSLNDRGVKVESEEKLNKIQFTINNSIQKIAEKNKQMEKVKDVILVQMPEIKVRETFEKWRKSGEIISGPDKFFDIKTKEIILEKMLKGLVPNELLDKKIKNAIM